jgi:hypothetical protein
MPILDVMAAIEALQREVADLSRRLAVLEGRVSPIHDNMTITFPFSGGGGGGNECLDHPAQEFRPATPPRVNGGPDA